MQVQFGWPRTELHKRSKHTDVRFYFVRDLIRERKLHIEQVSSECQVADIFTKPLKRVTYEHLRYLLGMM